MKELLIIDARIRRLLNYLHRVSRFHHVTCPGGDDCSCIFCEARIILKEMEDD